MIFRALRFGARQQDHFYIRLLTQAIQQFPKQLILKTVIEGFAGRRTDDNEHIIRFDSKGAQSFGKVWIGCKVSKVNIFLCTVIAFHLAA